MLDLLRRSDGHGTFCYHQQVFRHGLPDGTRHIEHILQIGAPVFIRRRTDGAEHDFDLVEHLPQFRCKMQTSYFVITDDQFLQPGLIDRDDPVFQVLNLTAIDVHTIDLHAHLCKTGTSHQTDISRTNDRNLHAFFIFFKRA